jgi:hypothetical protein
MTLERSGSRSGDRPFNAQIARICQLGETRSWETGHQPPNSTTVVESVETNWDKL